MQINAPNDDSLINLLELLSPESSKTTLRSWVKEGRVLVDGLVAKRTDQPVAKDQIISLAGKKKFADIKKKLEIIYEDRHIIAIDKPEGLLSVAANFQKEATAHTLVKSHCEKKVYVVHRIDQDTSGVMLFALSEEAYKGLKALFEKHDIERSYCAIVEGKLVPPKGKWTSYLFEDAAYRVHSTDDEEQGRIAVTHYTVEDTSPRYSRLKLTLETGRKNQIRVQCQDAGHPIAGDKKYGAATDPIKRLCLHAASIGFVHPVTGKQMRFTSPIPEKFYRLVRKKAGSADA